MNWLTPLCQEIWKLKSFTHEHRDTVTLWVSELSGICDSFVPQAPAPLLGHDAEQRTIELKWLSVSLQRALSLEFEENDPHASLMMLDKGRANGILRPTHDQLKTAVRSFFEGWNPGG